jgi:hypothetical protein
VDLGLLDSARAFNECLNEIYSEFAADIGPETIAYWRRALIDKSGV